MARLKDEGRYFKEREAKVNGKTQEICRQLPDYCAEYIDARKIAPLSKFAYAQDIDDFFHYLTGENGPFRERPVKDITTDDLQTLRVKELNAYGTFMDRTGYTASTKSRKLSAIRGLFNYLQMTEQIRVDYAEKIEMPTAKARNADHEIRYLTSDQIRDFLHRMKTNTVFDGKRQKRMQKWSLRNYAIVATFLHTGIRLSELVGLDIRDIDFTNQCLYIHRKGGKNAIVYINGECMEALQDYAEQRKHLVTEREEEPAFFISAKGKRLSARMVEKMIEDCTEACGFSVTSVHNLRRSYGTQFYDQVGDIYLLSKNLGHASVDVTAKYYAEILDRKQMENKNINLYGD